MNETGVSSDVRSCPVMTAGAFDSMATDVIGKRLGSMKLRRQCVIDVYKRFLEAVKSKGP
jgi:hypothetical protein